MIKVLVFDFFGTIRVEGKLDQDLLDYVLELKKTYKTALLSNVISLDRYVDLDLLNKYFDLVAASDQIGFAKPDSEAYFYVLDNLHVKPEEAVMVDDLELLLLGAQDIGMKGILYKNFPQLKSDLTKILDARAT